MRRRSRRRRRGQYGPSGVGAPRFDTRLRHLHLKSANETIDSTILYFYTYIIHKHNFALNFQIKNMFVHNERYKHTKLSLYSLWTSLMKVNNWQVRFDNEMTTKQVMQFNSINKFSSFPICRNMSNAVSANQKCYCCWLYLL